MVMRVEADCQWMCVTVTTTGHGDDDDDEEGARER